MLLLTHCIKTEQHVYHFNFSYDVLTYFLFLSADVPDKPDQPDVTDVDKNEMTVKWSSPYSDGGSKITGYIVEMKEPYSSRWSQVTKTTDFTFKVYIYICIMTFVTIV